jgi:hypothetical protein
MADVEVEEAVEAPGEPPARAVRFDVWVAGELADSETLEFDPRADDGSVLRIAERQSGICTKADAEDKKYLVDIEFWDGEHVRWGTDVEGMVIPVAVGVDQLAEAIGKRWEAPARPPCDAVKMGYVCERGSGHEPADLHAQLVRITDDGKLRVAIWREGMQGVLVTKLEPAAGAGMLSHAPPGKG